MQPTHEDADRFARNNSALVKSGSAFPLSSSGPILGVSAPRLLVACLCSLGCVEPHMGVLRVVDEGQSVACQSLRSLIFRRASANAFLTCLLRCSDKLLELWASIFSNANDSRVCS